MPSPTSRRFRTTPCPPHPGRDEPRARLHPAARPQRRRPGIAAAGGGTRYDYDYSAAELAEWAGIATDLARQAREVHVLFNNNARGAGTRNALALGDSARHRPRRTPGPAAASSHGSSRVTGDG